MAPDYYALKIKKKTYVTVVLYIDGLARFFFFFLYFLIWIVAKRGLYNRDSALLPVHARISRPRAAK